MPALALTPVAPVRVPRSPSYDRNLALLREAACRLDDNAREFSAMGDKAATRRARLQASQLWEHARAVRFDGTPLSPLALRTARAVLGSHE
jgi:hypothetical protein